MYNVINSPLLTIRRILRVLSTALLWCGDVEYMAVKLPRVFVARNTAWFVVGPVKAQYSTARKTVGRHGYPCGQIDEPICTEAQVPPQVAARLPELQVTPDQGRPSSLIFRFSAWRAAADKGDARCNSSAMRGSPVARTALASVWRAITIPMHLIPSYYPPQP